MTADGLIPHGLSCVDGFMKERIKANDDFDGLDIDVSRFLGKDPETYGLAGLYCVPTKYDGNPAYKPKNEVEEAIGKYESRNYIGDYGDTELAGAEWEKEILAHYGDFEIHKLGRKKKGEKIDPARSALVFMGQENYYIAYRRSYVPGMIVRKVPRSELGYNILGRTWPGMGIIEIAMDLYGDDFDEVLLHEMIHNENPESSEEEVRTETLRRLVSMGKAPKFHRSQWY